MDKILEYLLPPAKSTIAGQVDELFVFILIVSAVLLVGITFAIIFFSWKYKRRSENDVTPVITHNAKLEVAWSVIPLVLVMIVFGWGFTGYMNMRTVPTDAYEIRVVGKSWLWEFHYQNGTVSVNELHVPANRPVNLVMSSDDVIHSFYIPDYRVKRDVLPNRYSNVWFETTETGESVIFCTEYCGRAHSNMIAKVTAHSEEDFETWLANANKIDESLTPVELGKELITKNGCNACHSVDGSKMVGPSYKGLWMSDRELDDGTVVQADANYLRESILEPNAKIGKGYDPVMPSYQGLLNDREIDAIIEYIKTME